MTKKGSRLLKILKWCCFGLIICFCFWELKTLASNMPEKIRIEYLNPYQLSISSHGINRLHFEGIRVNKIIGDVNKYEASLNDGGSDLFLTSKVAAPAVINLSIQASDTRMIDLRLIVKEGKEGVILNIDASSVSVASDELKVSAREMIEHMAGDKKGKYFVEDKQGRGRIKLNSHLLLKDYVSYRYGDLKGIGFEISSITGKKKRIPERRMITKQEIAQFFDNVVAVGFKEDDTESARGKLFIVFNNRGRNA